MLSACNNNKQIQALAFIGGLNKERKLFKPFILVQSQEYWAQPWMIAGQTRKRAA